MKYTEENIRLILGLKIRQLRLDKKYSLKELSAKTGISISYLNEIEKGKKNPKPAKLAEIAESLDVSYDWLVSLQLGKKLAPFTDILHSNSIKHLPLSIFGIDSSRLMELFASDPARIGAFVNTVKQTAKSHGITIKQFYLNALRAYQELHDNYFPELEKEVEFFRKEHGSKISNTPSSEELKALLEEHYGLQVRTELFKDISGAEELNYIRIDKNHSKLLINRALNENQKAFAFAKELGFEKLGLTQRAPSFPIVEVNSFDEILNDFKTSYFASALLLEKDVFIEKAQKLLFSTQWQPWLFEEMVQYFHATPETILYRLTCLSSTVLGLDKIFFIRIDHKVEGHNFVITKEYHHSGQHIHYQNHTNEHYCRRWVSIKVLQQLKSQVNRRDMRDEILTNAQITEFSDSGNRYLVISIAQPSHPIRDEIASVSIGIQLDDKKSEKIGFLNDPKIKAFQAGHTCETCSIKSCAERIVPASKLEKEENSNKTMLAINNLLENYS